jgi:hypothetical protein
MTAGDDLIQRIVDEYYEADLPEDPAARLAILRDVASAEWARLPESDRVALAADLDDCEGVVAFAGRDPDISDEELSELDEQAVDGLTDHARREIPELSLPLDM